MVKDIDIIAVRNFTDQRVVYTIPEKNIRRDFSGFETKQIQAGELRELWFKSGGAKLLQDYLGVNNRELAKEFGITNDLFTHEYSWTNEDIDRVLTSGSEDELADALDYAPRGIVETIIDRAVALRIPNMNKRKLIKEMTDKDINKKIGYAELLATDNDKVENTPRRRRVPQSEEKPAGRRAG